VPVTAGAVADKPSTEAAGTVRLRPDPEARVKALSARETSAPGATDLAERGWQAYERGDIDTAHTAFSEAATRTDVRPWVLYALGMTQTALNKPADAITSWEKVRAAVPDFEPVYMDLADTYAHLGNLTQALAIVREAEKRWPASADVQSAIGVIHVRRGALNEGIAALEKAAALEPDDALAHLNVGRAYALRFNQGRRYVTSQRRWIAPEGDRQKAMAAFKRCVDLGGPYARQAAEELSLLEWSR
jgi:tetratricopeptide (TPR) repeat protein